MFEPLRIRHCDPVTARSALVYLLTGLLVLAAGMLVVRPIPAQAGAICSGKYHVLPLRAWPPNVALNVPLATNSAAGQTRAAAFRAGLQQAGVPLDTRSSIILQLVFSVSSSGDQEDVFTGLDWHRVDTEFSGSLKDPTLPGSSLSLTAIVNDSARRRNILVATTHCPIKTDDSEALARDIGAELGQVITSAIGAKR